MRALKYVRLVSYPDANEIICISQAFSQKLLLRTIGAVVTMSVGIGNVIYSSKHEFIQLK